MVNDNKNYEYGFYFKNKLVKIVYSDWKIFYHSVILNCFKKKLQNKSYGFEQTRYDRNGDKAINSMSIFFIMTTRY